MDNLVVEKGQDMQQRMNNSEVEKKFHSCRQLHWAGEFHCTLNDHRVGKISTGHLCQVGMALLSELAHSHIGSSFATIRSAE